MIPSALVVLTLMAPATSPASSSGAVIVLDFESTNSDPKTARLVTDLTTVILAETRRFSVLSSRDIKDRLELEGAKEAMGCDALSEDCMAEIASALGAQLIFSGSVGDLGGALVVTLGLFDSEAGKSLARKSVQVEDRAELKALLERKVRSLVDEATGVERPMPPMALVGLIGGGAALVGAGITGVVAGSDYATLTNASARTEAKTQALDRGLGLVIASVLLGAVAVGCGVLAVTATGE